MAHFFPAEIQEYRIQLLTLFFFLWLKEKEKGERGVRKMKF